MFPLSADEIAQLLNAPLANVELTWPAVEAQLDTEGIGSSICCVAALATIRVECPPFLPIHEYGSADLHEREYGHRADLGNTDHGDGAKYAGRGLIQITGKANYARYGELVGVDLVAEPDRALDPDVAAKILALYFKEHLINTLAEHEMWISVRRRVNGGTNGLADFLSYVQKLNAAIAAKG